MILYWMLIMCYNQNIFLGNDALMCHRSLIVEWFSVSTPWWLKMSSLKKFFSKMNRCIKHNFFLIIQKLNFVFFLAYIYGYINWKASENNNNNNRKKSLPYNQLRCLKLIFWGYIRLLYFYINFISRLNDHL